MASNLWTLLSCFCTKDTTSKKCHTRLYKGQQFSPSSSEGKEDDGWKKMNWMQTNQTATNDNSSVQFIKIFYSKCHSPVLNSVNKYEWQ